MQARRSQGRGACGLGSSDRSDCELEWLAVGRAWWCATGLFERDRNGLVVPAYVDSCNHLGLGRAAVPRCRLANRKKRKTLDRQAMPHASKTMAVERPRRAN